MRENTDQNNSEYEHFLRSAWMIKASQVTWHIPLKNHNEKSRQNMNK